MAVDVIGSNFHGVEKPSDYFKQIDDRKKAKAGKVESDFKTSLSKAQAKPSLRALEGGVAIPGKTTQAPGLAGLSRRAAPCNDDTLNDKNGMDLALKKVAEDFEKQILGIMWNLAFDTVNREFQGGLGEEIFHKELVNEMVKLSNTGEMGEIAQSIYNDLKAKEAVR